MLAKIEFNDKTSHYIGYLNNNIVVKSTYQEYVVKKLEGMGVNPADIEYEMHKEKAPAIKFSVAERFDFMGQFVSLISTRKLNSFIITGDAGIGKTYTVTNTLKNNGLIEDEDFIIMKGYSTAKGLYKELYENNGKVIVFDDLDNIHKDPVASNIMKAALDSGDKRIINWNAQFGKDDDLPTRFEFTGRCVFISNMPIDKFPEALISRSFCVDVTLTLEEKLDRICAILDTIDDDNKDAVMCFLYDYAHTFKELSVRSALNTLKLCRDIGNGWEKLALYTMTL